MPVVTTCVHEVSGAKFEAKLKVDTKGVFNIQRPGTTEDWPEESMTIAGRDADTVISTRIGASPFQVAVGGPSNARQIMPAKNACPRDTNGDGDCGRPACPHCGKHYSADNTMNNQTKAVTGALERVLYEVFTTQPETERVIITVGDGGPKATESEAQIRQYLAVHDLGTIEDLTWHPASQLTEGYWRLQLKLKRKPHNE